jgi:hypothetical protein
LSQFFGPSPGPMHDLPDRNQGQADASIEDKTDLLRQARDVE